MPTSIGIARQRDTRRRASKESLVTRPAATSSRSASRNPRDGNAVAASSSSKNDAPFSFSASRTGAPTCRVPSVTSRGKPRVRRTPRHHADRTESNWSGLSRRIRHPHHLTGTRQPEQHVGAGNGEPAAKRVARPPLGRSRKSIKRRMTTVVIAASPAARSSRDECAATARGTAHRSDRSTA